MAGNAWKYGALISTHRGFLLNLNTTVYPLLAQEGAINGALDVNQSYRWSSEILPHKLAQHAYALRTAAVVPRSLLARVMTCISHAELPRAKDH